MNKSVKEAVYFDILHESKTVIVPGDFPDIRSVLKEYRNTFIPDDVTLTIQLEPGVYEFTEPLNLGHWCGHRIIIAGAEPVSSKITAFAGYNATTRALSFKVSDTSVFQSSDTILVSEDNGGTNREHQFLGVWSVTEVTATTVTFAAPHKRSLTVFGTSTFTDGKISRFGSVLKFTGCTGINVSQMPCPQLRDIALVGDVTTSDTHGLRLFESDVNIKGLFGVTGFKGNGILLDNANLYAVGVVYPASCGNGAHGAYLINGAELRTWAFLAMGNGQNGINVETRARIFSTGGAIVTCNNQASGIVCKNGSISAVRIYSGDNNGYGIWCYTHGCVEINEATAGKGALIYANGTYDFATSNLGFILVQRLTTYVGAPTFYTPKNVLSASGSLITVVSES